MILDARDGLRVVALTTIKIRTVEKGTAVTHATTTETVTTDEAIVLDLATAAETALVLLTTDAIMIAMIIAVGVEAEVEAEVEAAATEIARGTGRLEDPAKMIEAEIAETTEGETITMTSQTTGPGAHGGDTPPDVPALRQHPTAEICPTARTQTAEPICLSTATVMAVLTRPHLAIAAATLPCVMIVGGKTIAKRKTWTRMKIPTWLP